MTLLRSAISLKPAVNAKSARDGISGYLDKSNGNWSPTPAFWSAATVSRMRFRVLALSPVARWIASMNDSSPNKPASALRTRATSISPTSPAIQENASICASNSARFTAGSIESPVRSVIRNAACPSRRCTMAVVPINLVRNRIISAGSAFRNAAIKSFRKRFNGVLYVPSPALRAKNRRTNSSSTMRRLGLFVPIIVLKSAALASS